MVKDDQQLITETLEGSLASFDMLMQRYEKLVYRVGYAFGKSRDNALDITQNAFLKTYENLRLIRQQSSFKGWLMRIVYNEGINWTRKNRFSAKSDIIDIETMGGEIEINNVTGKFSGKTMGGDLDLSGLKGDIDLMTMGGDIEATMTGNPDKGKRSVELTSKGGDITLTLPDGFPGDFDIQLIYTKNSERNYRIKSYFDLTIEESKEWIYSDGAPRKIISAVSASSGGKHLVHIETINGNITILKAK